MDRETLSILHHMCIHCAFLATKAKIRIKVVTSFSILPENQYSFYS